VGLLEEYRKAAASLAWGWSSASGSRAGEPVDHRAELSNRMTACREGALALVVGPSSSELLLEPSASTLAAESSGTSAANLAFCDAADP